MPRRRTAMVAVTSSAREEHCSQQGRIGRPHFASAKKVLATEGPAMRVHLRRRSHLCANKVAALLAPCRWPAATQTCLRTICQMQRVPPALSRSWYSNTALAEVTVASAVHNFICMHCANTAVTMSIQKSKRMRMRMRRTGPELTYSSSITVQP